MYKKRLVTILLYVLINNYFLNSLSFNAACGSALVYIGYRVKAYVIPQNSKYLQILLKSAQQFRTRCNLFRLL